MLRCLFIAAIVALVFASACGQKGPLFLPGDPSQINTEVPRTAEDQDDEDDDDSSQ